MVILVVIAAVVALVGIPALIINRDLIAAKFGRRQHKEAPLPFLIIPTSGVISSESLRPAWPPSASEADESDEHDEVSPEPGIADLPQDPHDYDTPAESRLWHGIVPPDADAHDEHGLRD
jgi:hypothetical protein